ncbi:MAG: hypothetical protein ACRYFX_20345 [Janthinobacterium lividum]
MKAFYLLLLAAGLDSSRAGAQQLRGGFVLANTPECSEFFHFTNGYFLHYGAGDMSPYYGDGTYRVKGDSLFLRFNDWQLPVPDVTLDSSFRVDSASGPTVRVLDAVTGEPLFGVTVRSETLPTIGASTDGHGLAQLPNQLPPDGKLSISLIGYETKFIEADIAKSRQFLVKLRALSNHHIAGNTRYSFLIKHPTNHSLLLQTRYSTYRAATPQQTQYYLAQYKKVAK